MDETPKTPWQTFTEEVEVAGHQLVEEINRLLAEGNIRKLQIRSDKATSSSTSRSPPARWPAASW